MLVQTHLVQKDALIILFCPYQVKCLNHLPKLTVSATGFVHIVQYFENYVSTMNHKTLYTVFVTGSEL